MATTTPNYGWTVPTSTDLVKDGATAIETLGDAIDASMNTALGTKKAGMVLLNTTSFSAVATQAVNNVFSATYDSYKIIINCTPTTTNPATQDMRLRLRVSGTDSIVSYDSAYWYRLDASFANTKAGFDGAWISGTGNRRFGSEINVYDPFNTSYTAIFANTTTSGDANQMAASSGTIHVVSASYTGFNLVCSSGTMTGSVNVYGFNK